LPFFAILRGSTKVEWGVEEQKAKVEWGVEEQKAFDDLKTYLEQLPTLSSPKQGQPLILYVSATHSAISGALVTEKEVAQSGKTTKQQFLVYFVSEALTGSQRFYSKVEKICHVVIMSVRKLRHYFEAHTIWVLTSQPLNDIFENRDISNRISKWVMELSEHVVDFEKHTSIKSQILADFVVEWMELGSAVEVVVLESPCIVNCDRPWGAVGAGAAAILTSPLGIKLCYTARLQFSKETFSKVINGQIEKKCIAREPTLEKYLSLA
jgi:hypothetical protein